MLFAALVSSLLAVGVSADVNPGEIPGLIENFKNADLGAFVGGDKFLPEGLLTGRFGTIDWTVGANLTVNETSAFPSFFVNPTAGSTAFNSSNVYSAILVDAGVAGSNETTQTLHWLINTIHVNTTGGSPYALAYLNGTTITEYAGPNPPANVGPHRYVLGLFNQPADFVAPTAYSQKNTPVGPFNLTDYLTQSKLGAMVAANYFTVQNGIVPSTVPTTTAVASSTLSGFTGAAPIPTAAGAEGGGTATNGTGDAAASSAAATSSTGGALGVFAPGTALVLAAAGAAALF
ncbi:hypothetical protein CspeluHIS016_0108360 [Cutaneotrichosporon spelunceum]|uniref:PEBP-like protein n=1 Tax=Cutaneotrichosporon spelunceum TaxID=1672016 RepID=A0AAD3TQ01_9TREE|nr:hypothetical protein CspeluHIS016_0108360 [Cutaneotrichosporon spelunceum]